MKKKYPHPSTSDLTRAEEADFEKRMRAAYRQTQKISDRSKAHCMKILKEAQDVAAEADVRCKKILKEAKDIRQEIALAQNAVTHTQKWMQIPVVEDNGQPSIDVPSELVT
jgi:dsDNA-specific endonuclease/ATPase MutS2